MFTHFRIKCNDNSKKQIPEIIAVSLWRIPDEADFNLMTIFYLTLKMSLLDDFPYKKKKILFLNMKLRVSKWYGLNNVVTG